MHDSTPMPHDAADALRAFADEIVTRQMSPMQAFLALREQFGVNPIGWEVVSHGRGLLMANASADIWRNELRAIADGAARLDGLDVHRHFAGEEAKKDLFAKGVVLLMHPTYGTVLFVPDYQKNLPEAHVRLFRVGANEAVAGPAEELRKGCCVLASRSHIPADASEITAAWAAFFHFIREVRPTAGSGRRITHCYRCKHNLDSDYDQTCNDCRWIVCSCGACGCQRYQD